MELMNQNEFIQQEKSERIHTQINKILWKNNLINNTVIILQTIVCMSVCMYICEYIYTPE